MADNANTAGDTGIANLAALYASQLGAIDMPTESFEGLATLIPNPVAAAEGYVLIVTAAGELFYCLPGRNNRYMFSAARDLAFEDGGTQVRVDAVGQVYYAGLGYDEVDGEVTALDEEYQIADLGNWAHRTYSVAAQTADENRSFEGVTLFRKETSGRPSRRGRSAKATAPKLTTFGEEYLNALRESAATGNYERIADMVGLLLTGFPDMFTGVGADGMPTCAAGSAHARIFATFFKRALQGRAQTSGAKASAEDTGAEDNGADEAPEPEAALAPEAPAEKDTVLDPGF